ncbi:hypothetical protein LUZ60_016673 [Juncus effusus]|nr:hypothetical protein LUZ60_016673 [Juncus effusus]
MESEQEEYVLLDLDDCVYSDIPPNAPYVLSGLDTLSPTLVIGDNLKLIGEYQDTIGTCYLFSESDAESSKQVKPLTSLQKVIKFRLVNNEDHQSGKAKNAEND